MSTTDALGTLVYLATAVAVAGVMLFSAATDEVAAADPWPATAVATINDGR